MLHAAGSRFGVARLHAGTNAASQEEKRWYNKSKGVVCDVLQRLTHTASGSWQQMSARKAINSQSPR